jgi:hypothetical protein
MSLCSSPRPLPCDNSAQFTAQNPSKEFFKWYQLHFITIPLVNRLQSATAPPKYTTRDDRHSPQLSPTPSLLGDEASISRHSSSLPSPRLSPQASPPPPERKRQSKLNQHPRRRLRKHRNTPIPHRMVTRAGSRRGKGRQAFLELDQSGHTARRVRR